jgi:hypothetical protein
MSLAKRRLAFGLWMLFLIPSVRAFDFGLALRNDFQSASGAFENKLRALPYFNAFFSDKLSLFLAFSFTNRNNTDGWSVIPEARRAEFFFAPARAFFLKAGRFSYTDATAFIADGIFDGISGSLLFSKARLTASAFYTGLLYKETAKILMSAQDRADYEDKSNYYAPKKAFTALEITVQDLFNYRASFTFEALGLLDIAKEGALNTQYFSINALLAPSSSLRLDVRQVTGLAWNAAEPTFQSAISIRLEAFPEWSPFEDTVTLRYSWASGPGDTEFSRFLPITQKEQGAVFTPYFSNRSTAGISDTVKSARLLQAELQFTAFFRTSFEVPLIETEDKTAASALGQEIYASIAWKPLTDLSFSAGFGVFFPNKTIYHDYTDINLWKFKLSAALCL